MLSKFNFWLKKCSGNQQDFNQQVKYQLVNQYSIEYQEPVNKIGNNPCRIISFQLQSKNKEIKI